MNGVGTALIGIVGPLALVAAFALGRRAPARSVSRAARAQLAFGAVIVGAHAAGAGAGGRRAALLAAVVLLALSAAAVRRCALPDDDAPSGASRHERFATASLRFAPLDGVALLIGLLGAMLAFDAVRDGLAVSAPRAMIATALATVTVDGLGLLRRATASTRVFRATSFGGAVTTLVASLPGADASVLATAALLAPAVLTGAPLLPRLAVASFDHGSDDGASGLDALNTGARLRAGPDGIPPHGEHAR